ncbi:type IV conjugative transfer system protein TraL [Piscirickettsia litoralis]|uniref:Type IV conjugative transfer system protein TraL n=1 Tax=Piscirickettsia litoralis TaxID=1891921 RepID=A0ABX2ZYU7_9GAMM|nr:type IV conjugative transfer system protein TraL [Piscirickettsia litoralis]ODN41403.1 type IV conjugative transfer system protein TraL [Piscirickettsia litoralis]
MKPIEIPRRVDEPPHLLLWSMDEFLPIGLGLVFGIMLASVPICLGIGLVIAHVYKRFRDQFPDGYLLHLLYRYGFVNLFARSRTLMNPFARIFYS